MSAKTTNKYFQYLFEQWDCFHTRPVNFGKAYRRSTYDTALKPHYSSRLSANTGRSSAELAGHGRQLPAYVKKEFDEYLKCGMYEHGFLLDGKEIYRNDGIANELAEPMFAILNFAKINNAAMTQNWEMEVDWVKYEAWQ